MSIITSTSAGLIEKFRLRNTSFILISNNCWGYELYKSTNREYNTPFVGLFIFPECYIGILENLTECLTTNIYFIEKSRYLGIVKYPVGLLCGKFEVHFLHYTSKEEARIKWARRSSRLLEDTKVNTKIFAKICDRDGFSSAYLERFHALRFDGKISLGINKFKSPNHIHCPELVDSHENKIIDGLSLYKKRYQYFDISEWILNGSTKHSKYSKTLSILKNY